MTRKLALLMTQDEHAELVDHMTRRYQELTSQARAADDAARVAAVEQDAATVAGMTEIAEAARVDARSARKFLDRLVHGQPTYVDVPEAEEAKPAGGGPGKSL